MAPGVGLVDHRQEPQPHFISAALLLTTKPLSRGAPYML
jgi:hypothetical protein